MTDLKESLVVLPVDRNFELFSDRCGVAKIKIVHVIFSEDILTDCFTNYGIIPRKLSPFVSRPKVFLISSTTQLKDVASLNIVSLKPVGEKVATHVMKSRKAERSLLVSPAVAPFRPFVSS